MDSVQERSTPTDGTLVGLVARAATMVLFGMLPALGLAAFLAAAVGDDYAFDFHQFWQGGRDVLHGLSPYPTQAQLANASDTLDPHGIQDVFRFPYPAGAAVAMVPFGALPFGLAAGILTVLLVGATVASLRVLGVTDWRCYGVVFLWMTTLGAIRLGTLTPLLVLVLALVWRYRDRARIAGPALAMVIVLKLFLLPLVVWLAATRRFAAATLACALGVAATAVAWLAIGFDGLSTYPTLLRTLAAVVADRGYSLDALVAALGVGYAGTHVRAMVAGCLIVAAVVLARRPGGDFRAFVLAVAAAVCATPIVWQHYFMLVLVPIAIARPRLTALWFVPLLYWLTPFQETGGDVWRVVLGLGVFAEALCVTLVSTDRIRRDSALGHV
jgi:hypothetical protein